MGLILIWLVLLVVLLVIEMATMGLTTIWFAAGALIAMFAALIGAPIVMQIVLFLLVSLVLLIFTRPIAMKYFNRDRVRTNVESVVGRQAVVTVTVDNLKSEGQVNLNGQEWSARTFENGVTIAKGSVVTVEAVSGVKLIVKCVNSETEKTENTEKTEETEETKKTEETDKTEMKL